MESVHYLIPGKRKELQISPWRNAPARLPAQQPTPSGGEPPGDLKKPPAGPVKYHETPKENVETMKTTRTSSQKKADPVQEIADVCCKSVRNLFGPLASLHGGHAKALLALALQVL